MLNWTQAGIILYLLKNVELFTPDYKGRKHVLVAGTRVVALFDHMPEKSSLIKEIDLDGYYLAPGFVDGLVHFCGGGGEGGFWNRTPPLNAEDAIKAGVTTLVGALGTDSITRNLASLFGSCRELTARGLSAFMYSGSYHMPVKSLTQSVETDMLFIPEILGVGEIALADHRGGVITYHDFVDMAKKTLTAASLAGKKGVIFCHLGDSPEQLSLLKEVNEHSDISITHFIPTHMNRNPALYEQAIAFALEGGYIDFTTSTNEELLADGEVDSPLAMARALDAGVSAEKITLSSDANASLPRFDQEGRTIGVDTGRIDSLFSAVVKAVREHGVDFSTALSCITRNPAQALGLLHKGTIAEGNDADLVVLHPDTLSVEQVWCRGAQLLPMPF